MENPVCLTECVSKFKGFGEIIRPLPEAILAPFVTVSIMGESDGKRYISVGNESSPAYDNTAVIKSFSIGMSNDAGCEIEVFDEAGGSFAMFMEKLNKCLAQANDDYRLMVEFGWVQTGDCGGTAVLDPAMSRRLKSNKFLFLPVLLESSYAEGKIKFIIHGTSLFDAMQQARASKTYPNTLKEAIRDLMADPEYPPIIARENVKFWKRSETPGGMTTGDHPEWEFAPISGDPKKGPYAPWPGNSQNKIAAAMNWLRDFRTADGKGFVCTWNADIGDGSAGNTAHVIFWEDSRPDLTKDVNFDDLCVGTFIVNGGECSPVIEFSPNAKWNFTALYGAGGATGGPMKGTTNESADKTTNPNNPANCCPGMDTKGAGTTSGSASNQLSRTTMGPDAALKETQISQRANKVAGTEIYSITAELRIQGMPQFGGQESFRGQTVALVVVNPHYLRRAGTQGCGEWLAQPSCNPVYTNKAWFIDGISHSISEGQFITTLKLYLATPGIDIGLDDPIGGKGSGGMIFPRRCK